MLCVIMPNVIMLSVVMLNVVALPALTSATWALLQPLKSNLVAVVPPQEPSLEQLMLLVFLLTKYC
jgi:hypothetical protein